MSTTPTTYQRTLPAAFSQLLIAIADRGCDQAELSWIERVEQRRTELKASRRLLTYVDYGAGSPQHQRTAEEMYTGSPGSKTIGDLTTVASKERKWASLLFRLIRDFKPDRCLELGASVGISGAYQAAALELNSSGKLVTLEGGQAIAAVAAETFEVLGLAHRAEVRVGRFQDLLEDVLVEHYFDYVYIDGHHDGGATRRYFSAIVSAVRRPAVVVFDDITWSEGMQTAWRDSHRHEDVSASFDLGPVGVCLVSDERPGGQALHFSIGAN